jgi:hypothetical protein
MMAVDMQMDFACRLHTLTTHGRDFLTSEEFGACQDRLLNGYYNFLAVSLIRGRRDKKFWDYHKRKLTEAVGFSRTRLAGEVVARVCKAVLNPYETIAKLQERRTPSVAQAGSGNVVERRSTPTGHDRIYRDRAHRNAER